MGSDTGQDSERPIHRVWIDAFLLAATQVTNAEYARFLRATGDCAARRSGATQTSTIPSSPSPESPGTRQRATANG